MSSNLRRRTLGGLLLAMVVAASSSPAAEPPRPNVLLICVDDLKPALGCYGDPLARSPNIDRLAARGVLFERAYCNQAVCSPSRNALLTGLRSQTIGIYDLATNFRQAVPDATALPQWFKQHGYHTEGLGKIFHVGHGNHDDADSWSVPHWKSTGVAYALSENRPTKNANRQNSRSARRPPRKQPRGAPYERADVPDNTYPDGTVSEEAIRRLQTAAKRTDQPFFLAVGFVKPHLPFCAPAKYWDRYQPEDFALAQRQTPPDGAPSYAPQFGGELRNYAGVPKEGTLPDDLQRSLIHGYYAAVSYMDAQVGRVLDELDRLKLAGNTVIVLWGDHGWHLGDHGIWCKHTNYEQAARIPLIVVAPKQTATLGAPGRGRRTQALAESVDIFPTLCDLAGLPTPESQVLDGASFLPILRDADSRSKPVVFHAYPRSHQGQSLIGRAVRTERYRLVEWKLPGAAPETAELELYDYESDPAETKNLADSQPEVVAELRAILAKLPEAKPQVKAPPVRNEQAASASAN
jgi:iduronate 2-sulfatase